MLVKSGIYEPCENIFNYAIKNKKSNLDASIEVQAVMVAFFNALLEKIKDINCLSDSSRNESIELISRTYFEQYVYAMYILKTDTERRAKAF